MALLTFMDDPADKHVHAMRNKAICRLHASMLLNMLECVPYCYEFRFVPNRRHGCSAACFIAGSAGSEAQLRLRLRLASCHAS